MSFEIIPAIIPNSIISFISAKFTQMPGVLIATGKPAKWRPELVGGSGNANTGSRNRVVSRLFRALSRSEMTFRPLAKSPYWVELAAHVSELRLWQFFLSNFPLSRNVSSLKIGIFLLSFNWSFIKQVVISLPLKQMRRMLQEALRHEIVEPVLLTVMYLIRYFQGVRCVDCEINPRLTGN